MRFTPHHPPLSFYLQHAPGARLLRAAGRTRGLALLSAYAFILTLALTLPSPALGRTPKRAAAVFTTATAPAQTTECNGGRGGTLFADDKEVEVEILPGNPAASYTSDLLLSVDGRRPINFGSSRDAGRVTRIGRVPAGTELAFFIIVRNTGHTFFMGDASRNPDGVPHADVHCLGDGKANVSFEDLINGGDNSYNDITFQVRTSPLCNANSTRRAKTEQITGFNSCGSGSVGTLSASYGSFGSRTTLESDAGEKLQLRCDPGSIPSYHLYFAKPGGGFNVVGTCPFVAGCNTASFKHSGDADGNGKPDCFVQTYWKSRDYGANDNPNHWTGQTESTPVLDHAVSTYDVINNRLVEENLKYRYRIAPPIACTLNSGAEGQYLGRVVVGTRSFASVNATLFASDEDLQQPSFALAEEEMSEDPFSMSDLNRDGQLDAADRAIFDAAFGSCEGQPGYDPAAEFNSDRCITLADEEAFLDIFEAGSNPTDNRPPVASCATVTLAAAADSCTVTISAADVDGGSSDPDGDAFTLSLGSPATLGVGTHEVTLIATDSHGASSSCIATVTVVDGTPPALGQPTVSHPVLSPPNHKMHDVTVNYLAADNCGPVATTLSVTSNEPSNGQGDGNTSADWEVVDAHHVRLRAERSGGGSGRIYTITVTATDAAGNTTQRSVEVSVPHN